MKIIQTVALAIALVTLFAACQSTAGQTQGLSNNETRKAIMDSIANDSLLSKEMLGTMMYSQNDMMRKGNQNTMMKVLKNNPGMMQIMMLTMMETAKGDTSLMQGMIKTMMANQPMMNMMQNMTGNNRMNDMPRMGRMGK